MKKNSRLRNEGVSPIASEGRWPHRPLKGRKKQAAGEEACLSCSVHGGCISTLFVSLTVSISSWE